MEKKKFPKNLHKFIRHEKARIRREVLSIKDQEELINELYKKHLNENDNSRNIQSSNK